MTGVISSIGLLVGGIGVMNVMLISVTERTQEIGLRKATGATKFHIRAQFLFEAVMLSGAGGAIGILIGAFIAFVVRSLIPSVPATLSIFWILMGAGISVSVGLFFGYYPATRAAKIAEKFVNGIAGNVHHPRDGAHGISFHQRGDDLLAFFSAQLVHASSMLERSSIVNELFLEGGK